MKKFKAILLFAFALALISPTLRAQDISTQGKEFWVSYIGNSYKENTSDPNGWIRIQLLISAKHNCEGDIINPNTGWTRHFEVEADNIFSIDIDPSQAYIEVSEYGQVVDKGLQVITTDTVSVYCANIATYSFDASYVLPIDGIADDYIIQTYDQSGGIDYNPTSAFVIVATEDNTTVDITPSVKTLDNHDAGTEYTITLNKGQAYQVRSNMGYTGNRDLSGTRVTARDCKRIAVFNGNNLSTVPTDAGSDADCIFEQAMPLRSWGKKFVVTSSLNRIDDYVKITSSSDGNEITRNGTHLCTLNANESYTYRMPATDKSSYIEATFSCAVYLFNSSSSYMGNGAPSMVWISPIEQRINEITFSTFNYDYTNVTIGHHYVNIIVENQDTENVTLDGILLNPDQFDAVNGSSTYSYIRKEISHGVHHLNSPHGFNAHVYGFDRARGYAYMVGSKATDLSTSIIIDDLLVSPYDTVSNCTMDEITFFADINLSDYNLVWEFGDGQTSTDNPTTHAYSDHDLYQAKLTVTTADLPCGGSSDSNTTFFYIDSRREPDLNYSDETCAGSLYTGHGFSNVAITADTTLSREEPGELNPGCTRLVSVHITCYPVNDTTINDLVCFKGPDTYNNYGFDLPYDAPGTYTASRVGTNQYGCERTVFLNLVVGDATEGTTENISDKCDFYEWNGVMLYESGQYTDTVANDDGCYTINRLDLTLEYTPHPTPIHPVDTANTSPHWVITATEFQINTYDFTLDEENPHCEWDTVDWSIESYDSHWVLEPFGEKGKSCKVYVLNRSEDTVWLTAKVFNGCVETGIERKYWLLSSFYDVEENLLQPKIDIVPNPNHGEMEIVAEGMDGEVEAKVYDMRGLLVGQFKFSATHQSRFSYRFDGHPSGMYLLVFNNNGCIITKKAIVIK